MKIRQYECQAPILKLNLTSRIYDLTIADGLIVTGTEVIEPPGLATAQLATVGSPGTCFNCTRWIFR